MYEGRLEDVIACSGAHMAVVTQEYRVVCWGYNGDGQCDVPSDLENVVAVSCGNGFPTHHPTFLCYDQRIATTTGDCIISSDLHECCPTAYMFIYTLN
jgi:alpha-tubulin suppressor-like RCC1 family protein